MKSYLILCSSILLCSGIFFYRTCMNNCNDINVNSFVNDDEQDEVYSKIPVSQVMER